MHGREAARLQRTVIKVMLKHESELIKRGWRAWKWRHMKAGRMRRLAYGIVLRWTHRAMANAWRRWVEEFKGIHRGLQAELKSDAMAR